MPSSIPYDPSLVLANVVDNRALNIIQQISEAAAPADAAQNNLNALISMRRSLDMTRNELTNLGINVDECNKRLNQLNEEITTAANEYVAAKIEAEGKIKPLRASIRGVSSQAESPVDYTATQIKSLPLSSDSMNMDVQYFSMDSNVQTASSYASTIGTFVAASTSWMGTAASREMSTAAQSQASRQASKKSLSGTLVLSVSCTHKNASVLAPFVLNPDKAIGTWNQIFPDDQLDPTNRKQMLALTRGRDEERPKHYSILSGMTFGSSFVGMVHVLNNADTAVAESMNAAAQSMQAQMEIGSWFENASGGFGVNSTFANDVKNLLSSQNITTHVTLISMGVIPSMVASEVKLGVQAFAKFDPKSTMEAIAQLQNSTVQGQNSVQAAAQAARTGKQMATLHNMQVKAALEGLAEIDDGHNKMLDINSMMSALDDYLKKAAEGTSGVPLTYYLKEVTKKMLAQAWTAKYYPNYQSIRHDDNEAESRPPPAAM
ncbi:hypothetical protein F5Y17DRAFT_17294 [Xylariaceae sp. FL0594]|nr:hypothetical protein F5Y17DRAFT_17294 [Xylariaceae sp. FL0594]